MRNQYRLSAILLAMLMCPLAYADETAKPEADAEPKAAKEEKKLPPQEIKVAEERLMLPVPGEWKKVQPRSRIVEVEFTIPEAKKGVGEGRMTIMASGGSLKDNITRWIGQFRTAEGKPLEGVEPKEVKVGELKVTMVDLSGTYRDMPRGPFGPATELPDHRMMGAIIPTDGEGTYFVKLYGPEETMDKAAKKFKQMIEGIEWK